MTDPYILLGVNKTDSFAVIKKKYKDLLQKYHPDVYPNKEEAIYKTNLIIKAYKSISNEIESISILKSITHNKYKFSNNSVDLYLKKEYKTIFTFFNEDNQVYMFKFKLSEIPSDYSLYFIKIHYFQKTENSNFMFKVIELSRKMKIDMTQKIILREKGDFDGKNFKNLVIYIKVVK